MGVEYWRPTKGQYDDRKDENPILRMRERSFVVDGGKRVGNQRVCIVK
jgi:hypothetical protein